MSIDTPKLPGVKPSASYDVGYAKPPVSTRFKKGTSGNPRGRPKGAKNKTPALLEERLKTIVLEEAYRTITVQDGGRSVTIPMAQAVMRAMAVNAVKGQHRAQRLFSELLSATETSRNQLHLEHLQAAINYKFDWDNELDRRAKAGITNLPEPLPHPDDVKIDMRTGSIRVIGPMSKDEKAVLDDWLQFKPEVIEAVAHLKQDLERDLTPKERAEIERSIKKGETVLDRYETGDLPMNVRPSMRCADEEIV